MVHSQLWQIHAKKVHTINAVVDILSLSTVLDKFSQSSPLLLLSHALGIFAGIYSSR